MLNGETAGTNFNSRRDLSKELILLLSVSDHSLKIYVLRNVLCRFTEIIVEFHTLFSVSKLARILTGYVVKQASQFLYCLFIAKSKV